MIHHVALSRRAALALAVAALAGPLAAQAQSFPNKPITIVIPYPPGGTTDTLVRVMQDPLQKILGQPIVIDNRPGGSAIVATKLVQNAAPDGYTLLVPNNALAITPHLQKEASWTVKSFEPISTISLQPMVLITNPVLPSSTPNGRFGCFPTADPIGINNLAASR